MKLNSTDRALSLVLHTLDTAVAPDLGTDAARGAAQLIRTTLLDLLKRQGPSAALLARCITQGEAVAAELAAALGETADALPDELAADFESLAARHERLTARIDALCARLSAQTADSCHPLLRRAAEWEARYYVDLQTIEGGPPAIAPPSAPPLSREFLRDFLNSRRHGDEGAVEVSEFAPLLGGFGKQTYLCTIRDARGVTQELVVRKSDPTPIMMHGVFRLEQEYALLCDLAKTDFPAPHPLELAHGLAGVDGTFYTMKRLPGSVPGSFLGGEPRQFSESLLLKLAELLAKLHRIPLDTFADYSARYEDAHAQHETIGQRYRRNLRGWRDYVREVEHLPSPFVTWMLDWLEHHVPDDSRRAVLTHGDFNVHNVLALGDEITAVLDWECADFGAPEQDLAYIQPHISRHIDWQRFVDHYRACGGPEIDAARMPFCLVYSALRTFLGGNRGTLNLQRGVCNDLRYIMVEQGFAPAFMQMALECSAGP